MNAQLAAVGVLLARVERLARDLADDPDGHVWRSTTELRTTFDARGPVEPAVARVLDSVVMLRRGQRNGARREFQRRAHGIDRLEQVLEGELLPTLRVLGFLV
ncbi:MAG TPA: hypothetical protein VD833_07600 [Vicinamibacterales bacterium]|nr:hypothetical protein [Vicinamibacterales bacterium]